MNLHCADSSRKVRDQSFPLSEELILSGAQSLHAIAASEDGRQADQPSAELKPVERVEGESAAVVAARLHPSRRGHTACLPVMVLRAHFKTF
jgi:hypothetical protein